MDMEVLQDVSFMVKMSVVQIKGRWMTEWHQNKMQEIRHICLDC